MLYNFHTHTHYSHDSDARFEDICECAARSGLDGVLFSDHCDCEYEDRRDHIKMFSDAYREYLQASQAYSGRVGCYFGIELGDPHFDPAFADRITRALPFDAVLLSVHAVKLPDADVPFSTLDFSAVSQDFLDAYLRRYFEDVLFCVRRFDFDVLCHLTVPLRYITLKYGRTADIRPHLPLIRSILEEVINRGKTLELNTSMVSEETAFYMPDETLLELYISLGGTGFSLGSDAHTANAVSHGLIPGAKLLKSKGITHIDYYRNRKKRSYSIENI